MKLTEAIAKHTTNGQYQTKDEVKEFLKNQLPKVDQKLVGKSAQVMKQVNYLRWGVISKTEFKSRIKELR